MKKLVFFAFISVAGMSFGQTEEKENKPEEVKVEMKENDPDTTRFNIGNSEVIVISRGGDGKNIKVEEIDTIDAGPEEKKRHNEAHWSGLELGFNNNLSAAGTNSFPGYPYWENDPAKSIYFNINLFEKKFKIVKEYVGLTTGLGFNFNSFAFKNNYELVDTVDMIYAKLGDTKYSKNKLKASYLQLPLLLEFNTKADNRKGFYVAAGVIGGVRLTSKIKREGEFDGKEFQEKTKGTYSLNPYKLDATARLGYKNIGLFANYSLVPLFESSKTVGVYPLTFGLTMGF